MSGQIPKAVIFDFGGVLCFSPVDEDFRRIAELFGLPIPKLLPLFWARRIDYDAGRLSPAEYWSELAQCGGVKWNEALLPELTRCEVGLWNRYDQRVLAWAAQLQKAGFRTAILSNLPRSLGDELRATPGFLERFDHLTFSYEVGASKPEPAIYEDAIRGVGVPAGEALFLDDKRENIEGARRAGLRAELYSTWEEFSGEALRRWGLPMLLQSP